MDASSALESPRARTARSVAAAAAAIGAGVAVYLASCLVLPPGPEPVHFGVEWARMSEQPFAFGGQFPHRLLAPLLAHVLGFGGTGYATFACGLSMLLLAVVFQVCRARGNTAVDALLVTAAVGFAGPVQMYKQCWVAYGDDLGYALALLGLLAARRPVVFWCLFAANLLTHELALFLAPWLWFVRRRAGGSPRADVVGLCAASAAYAAFYLYVRAHAAGSYYDVAYFAEHQMFPLGALWLWVLAFVQWAMVFGPLLAVLAWHQAAVRGGERLHLWLVAGAVLAILCVAFDVTRHANLLVLPFVLAASRFLAAGHRGAFVAVLAAAVAVFALLDPFRADAWPLRWFLGATLECGAYTDFSRVLTCLLPRTWPAVLAILGLHAAIAALGVWFARRAPA